MEPKNIFESDAFEGIMLRIHKLQAGSRALWGKMTAAQMLAHMSAALNVITADAPPPRMLAGKLFGWLLKPKAYDASAMKKNMPTVPSFLVTDEKDFEKEKQNVLHQLKLLKEKGQAGVHNIAHPFFGKLTGLQWGKGTWKHFNHHFEQFGI